MSATIFPSEEGRRGNRNERGQVMAMTAIGLIALCAVAGLAGDIGYFFDYRRRMQTGADAAAMAGAEQLRRAGTPSMNSAAQAAAATDGFTDGTDGTQVAGHSPPLSGHYAGDPSDVGGDINPHPPTPFPGGDRTSGAAGK